MTAATPFAPSAEFVTRPLTIVFFPVAGSESHDARSGILIPPVTVPFEFMWPNTVSGTSLLVFGTSSIAANLAGSLL